MTDTPTSPEPQVLPQDVDAPEAADTAPDAAAAEAAAADAAQNPSVASPKSLPAFAYSSPPSRRTTVVRTIIVIGFFIFVYGILLPRFIDYQAVLDALQALTGAQLAVMLVLGLIMWVLASSVQAALLPGLGLVHSTESFLSGQAVSNTIPGPVDLAVRYILYRQWGHAPEPSSLSIVLAGVFDQLAALEHADHRRRAPRSLRGGGPARSRSSGSSAPRSSASSSSSATGACGPNRSRGSVAELGERFLRAVFHFIRRPTPVGIAERALALRGLGEGPAPRAAACSPTPPTCPAALLRLRLHRRPPHDGRPRERDLGSRDRRACTPRSGSASSFRSRPAARGRRRSSTSRGSPPSPRTTATQISAGVFLYFTVQWILPDDHRLGRPRDRPPRPAAPLDGAGEAGRRTRAGRRLTGSAAGRSRGWTHPRDPGYPLGSMTDMQLRALQGEPCTCRRREPAGYACADCR